METTVRQISEPQPQAPQEEFVKNEVGASVEPEPIYGDSMPQAVLDVLGIEENLADLPTNEAENVREIASYLEDQIKSSGKTPNVLTMGRKLDEIREELEMDDQTEMSVVLDRVGGVVKAWKNIGFISDPREKRALFMKLARCPDSRSMHKLVFNEMDKRRDGWH